MTTMTALITKEPETIFSETYHFQPSAWDAQIVATQNVGVIFAVTQDITAAQNITTQSITVAQNVATQEELVMRALRGEEEAFNDIVAQYSAMQQKMSYRMLLSRYGIIYLSCARLERCVPG